MIVDVMWDSNINNINTDNNIIGLVKELMQKAFKIQL